MKRLVMFLVLSGLLIPLTALAQDAGCGKAEMLTQLRQQADRMELDPDSEPDESLLFYQFNEGLTLTEQDSVEVEVLVDGEHYLTERIRFAAGEKSDSTVVELLSRAPEPLAHLHELSQQGAEVKVVFLLNAQEVERLSFEELVDRNRSLKEEMDVPRQVIPFLDLAERPEADLFPGEALEISFKSCESDCEDQYDYCVTHECDGDCEYCDDEYTQCLIDCGGGGGGCTPTSEIVVVGGLYSITSTGYSACFWAPPWYDRTQVYDWKRFRHKYTRKRIETHADCSQTVTVLSIWYVDVYCYLFSYGTCYNPVMPYSLC
ncbi:MAG: hypothetical protein GY856_33405 [bacterium]|nr:hypothetical protein [bacterium]